MSKMIVLLMSTALAAFAGSADADFKADIVKHLETSRDFTVKVAEAMPAATASN